MDKFILKNHETKLRFLSKVIDTPTIEYLLLLIEIVLLTACRSYLSCNLSTIWIVIIIYKDLLYIARFKTRAYSYGLRTNKVTILIQFNHYGNS